MASRSYRFFCAIAFAIEMLSQMSTRQITQARASCSPKLNIGLSHDTVHFGRARGTGPRIAMGGAFAELFEALAEAKGQDEVVVVVVGPERHTEETLVQFIPWMRGAEKRTAIVQRRASASQRLLGVRVEGGASCELRSI